MARTAPFEELQLNLLWGAWEALGVTGVARTHRHWAIDPEPLILATALWGQDDRRLLEESLDWCSRYGELVSRVRLRNLARQADLPGQDALAVFMATVNEHSNVAWPSSADPLRWRPSGKALMPDLDVPARVWLRLRAIFGVGARSEVLRYFLTHRVSATAALLADRTAFAKRVVQQECESLVRAGVLTSRTERNRHLYRLSRRDEVTALLGGLPDALPDWTALLHLTSTLVGIERSAQDVTSRILAVHAAKAGADIREDLELWNIDLPSPSSWVDLETAAGPLIREWAQGRMPDATSA